MKTLTIKLATGIASVGSLGGGVAYGIHKYNDTTNSVEHYLKESSLNIIAKDNATFWEKVYKTYALEKTSSNLEIDNKTINGKDDIKNWCHEEKNSLIKGAEDTLFKKVKKWCTAYKTIKETFGDKKLNTDVANLKTKYTNLNPDLKEKINKITGKAGDNEDGEKFKEWCEINSDRSYSSNTEVFAKDIKANCLSA